MKSLHCVQFYLDKPLSKKSLVFPQICNGWQAPFKLINDIAAYMLAEDDFNNLFDDLRLELYIYMGYAVIFRNQNNGIKNMMEK